MRPLRRFGHTSVPLSTEFAPVWATFGLIFGAFCVDCSCAAAAPFGAVLLVMHGALASAAAALGGALLAAIALFFVLPFGAIATVAVAVGEKRKILYALAPHWHAISWQHSPALWRHRVALAGNAEALSHHAGNLLADGAPLLRPDRLEALVPLLPQLLPHIKPLAQRVDQLAPYFDQLLPHLDTLAPYLPQMLPHIDQMIGALDHLVRISAKVAQFGGPNLADFGLTFDSFGSFWG